MIKLSKDENIVKAFFESFRLGVDLFDEVERQAGRNPDFKVSLQDDGFFFFCEVKSLNTEVTNDGLLHSRVFNIYTAGIHDSFGQFKVVNSQHFVPNVLAYVSHNFQMNSHNFKDFLQGYISIPNGDEKESVMPLRKVSSSNHIKELEKIDLILFFLGDKPDYIITSKDQRFINKLIRIFGIKEEDISRLSLG